MKRKPTSLFVLVSIPVLIVVLLSAILVGNERQPRIKIPSWRVPSPNGRDDFFRAADFVQTNHQRGPLGDSARNPFDWPLRELKAFADANAPAFAAVRAGLSKPCICAPAFRFDKSLPNGRLFEGAPALNIREMARRLVGEGIYYQKLGQHGRAMDSRLDCIQMGSSLPRGSGIAELGLGLGLEEIGGWGIRDLLPLLDRQELARCAKRLEHIRLNRPQFSEFVLEEGYRSAAYWQECLSRFGRMELVRSPNFSTLGRSDTRLKRLFRQASFLCSSKSSMVTAELEYHKALAAEQNRDYTGTSKVPAPTSVVSDFGLGTRWIVYSRKCVALAETRVTLMEAEVALRRYRLDRGSYPAFLRALTPKYLEAVPIDPFGKGKPLRYKRAGSGRDFVLYSIGPDFVDNHASPGNWRRFRTGDLLLQ